MITTPIALDTAGLDAVKLSRRTLLAGAAALLVASPARAAAVTDAAGRAVPIPDAVARVFPAGPPAAILLYAVAPDLLLGWPRPNRPDECAFMLPDICKRPVVGRLTGRGNTANLETVLALKPDLILDVGSTSATFVSLAARVQEQTGIPYALLDGRFEATAPTLRKVGELIHRQAAADALAAYAEQAITTIKARIDPIPAAQRPRIYYARGPRGLDTALGGSINVETIEFLGARNVAAERKGGLASVSMEQVLVWNPDIIVTIDADFAANVRNDPQWASVAAVRAGRVYLSPTLPFGWVDFPPSVNRLIGLWWLAKILYPAQFPEDMQALARDFYTRFYHVTPSDADIARVLAGRA
jgi:iron complex transport system substrate-binding protein